jgi:foldase protein PrsA
MDYSDTKPSYVENSLGAKPRLSSRKLSALLLVLAVLVALVAVLFYFRGIFVAAVVNGRPITRIAVIRELERQNGGRVLDAMITQKLIRDEAKKQGVTVSGDEISAKVKDLEDQLSSQGQSLDNVLGAQNVSRSELEDQIRTQLLVEKILGPRVGVSDEEVSKYIEENKDRFPEDTDFESEEFRGNIKEQLKNQKMSREISKWIGELKSNASIRFFVEY